MFEFLKTLWSRFFPQPLPPAELPPPYPSCVYPLPVLPDGREGKVTSRGRWANPSRPSHNGDDWMYKRSADDTNPMGDGEGTSNGKWNVPPGTPCLAVRSGIVRETSFGAIGTGLRCYVQHEDGYRSGYFHLSRLAVSAGQLVHAGDRIGDIGDNPKVVDPRHLHFEVSKGIDYSPVDPLEYLRAHSAVHSTPRGGW